MTTINLKTYLVIIIILSSINIGSGQCDYYDDFSSPGDWTQVGSLVEVTGGELQYINGAPDAVQRRVYKELTGTVDNICIERSDYCSESFGEETYLGCENDGYSVEVNGNIYF